MQVRKYVPFSGTVYFLISDQSFMLVVPGIDANSWFLESNEMLNTSES